MAVAGGAGSENTSIVTAGFLPLTERVRRDYVGSARGLRQVCESLPGAARLPTIRQASTIFIAGIYPMRSGSAACGLCSSKSVAGTGDHLRTLIERRVPLIPVSVDHPSGFRRLMDRQNR